MRGFEREGHILSLLRGEEWVRGVFGEHGLSKGVREWVQLVEGHEVALLLRQGEVIAKTF